MHIIASILVALGFLSCASAQVYYQPASGFYVCPSAWMVCNVVGCGGGDCSTISNGFLVSTVDDTIVYTSTMENADLSITGGDDTAITCDVSCACQPITSKMGCNVPISSDERSELFQNGMVDQGGQEYISEANSDSSGKSLSFGGGILFALAVASLM